MARPLAVYATMTVGAPSLRVLQGRECLTPATSGFAAAIALTPHDRKTKSHYVPRLPEPVRHRATDSADNRSAANAEAETSGELQMV